MKKGLISMMLSIEMFFVGNFAIAQDNLLRTYFPNYKADKAILVKDSSNFYFNGYYNGPWAEGYGFKEKSPNVEYQLFVDPYEEADFVGVRSVDINQHKVDMGNILPQPAMLPLLIVCSVPSGTKEVKWLLPEEVEILRSPRNSQINVSGSHSSIITPTLSDSLTELIIENPYLVTSEKVKSNWNSLEFGKNQFMPNNSVYDKKLRFTNFYVSANEKYEVKHPFEYTYLIIQSNNKGYKKIITQLLNDASSKGSVVSQIEFVDPPDVPEIYDIVISGGPKISPLDIVGRKYGSNLKRIDYVLNITNACEDTIDLDEILVRIAPRGNWFTERIIRVKDHLKRKTYLVPKAIETIEFSIDKVNSNEFSLSGGVAKAIATAIFPTSDDSGVKADLDLSYRYGVIPEVKDLAGIRTKLYLTQNNELRLSMDETAGLDYVVVNDKQVVSWMPITSIDGSMRGYSEILFGGSSGETTLNNRYNSFTINYQLYRDNKVLGNYQLNLKN